MKLVELRDNRVELEDDVPVRVLINEKFFKEYLTTIEQQKREYEQLPIIVNNDVKDDVAILVFQSHMKPKGE